MSIDLSSRSERRLDREASLDFKPGDPGKRVDAHVPTALWKMLSQTAAREGLTIGYAAALALSEWARRNV